MPSGLTALLDDIAVIARSASASLDDMSVMTRAAAASLDDVGVAAGRAGTKTAGVVIDDAAVTPRYVTGLSPARELPIIWAITKGSLKNKLLILLPGALILSEFLPSLIVWLLINESLAPGHIILGTVLAVAIPLVTRPLQPFSDPRVIRPFMLLQLLWLSLLEIIRSAFAVAQIIVVARSTRVRSQFVRIPLDLQDRYGLALLSCLINVTPGTVWVEILPGTHSLALHVLDLHNEEWWINTIKTRYEAPLIAIFEGRSVS